MDRPRRRARGPEVCAVHRHGGMPSALAILDQLTFIANRFRGIAVVWHLATVLVLAAVGLGWRPSRRTVALLLAGPLASVAALAGITGNPFSGLVFALLAGAIAAVGFARGPGPRIAWGTEAVLPIGLIGFGLVYPHFLPGASWLGYAYAAPVGLIPCPTLALVMGFTLLLRGLESRRWRLVLAAAGLFYGLLGMIRLRVYLDAPLLVGAAALVVQTVRAPVGRVRPATAGDGLLAYFAVAFGISWSTASLVIAAGGAPSGPGLGGAALVFLAMLLGPSSAAVGVSWWRDGLPAVRRLGAACLRWRLPLRWYGLAALAPITLALLLGVLSLRWPALRPGIVSTAAPGELVITALVVGLLAGCFEELGWTGFATPRLLARYSPLRAGLALGVPWALWHALPDHWGTAGSFGPLWVPHMLEWVVGLTAFRVLMTWAYARTASLPLAMLMHAGFTGGQLLLGPTVTTPQQGLAWYGGFALILCLLALAAQVLRPQGRRPAPGRPLQVAPTLQ